VGKDFTLFALSDGTVAFKKGMKNRTFVHIVPSANGNVAQKAVAPVAKVQPAPAPAPAPIVDTQEEE
jgi:hypothetical protein